MSAPERVLNELLLRSSEKEFGILLEIGVFGLQGKIARREKNPDFIFSSSNVLLEVYDKNDYRKHKKYGSVRRYKNVITRFYHGNGYEVVYLESQDIYRYPMRCVRRLKNFVRSLSDNKKIINMEMCEEERNGI